ncbi:zinc metalloprotease HtpX [Microgenomates group bacterium RBG_19FT_COMBO_39_10]|nr:MAG: zinc metalloprotease HtpX [Microgenomates group bacterium RBG_19FT_COMBO_39_10]
MINVYEQVDQNKRRSTVIMVLFVVVITFFAWVLAYFLGYGLDIVGLALILAGLMSFVSYWWSDKIILAISKARPADKERDFNFFTVTENLAMAAQIPKPQLYVIEDTAPNAFATGRDPKHAVVCATTGLLKKLDRTELEGVVAHELSHVRNYDIRLMSLVTILVGMITLLADWFLRGVRFKSRDKESGNLGGILFLIGLVLIFLSPIIAQLMKLALARRRELLADASAVMLTRQPQGLMRALEKISADKEPLEVANKATAHLYITNPLKNRHDKIGWFANFFNTHPPIEERIKALKAMS